MTLPDRRVVLSTVGTSLLSAHLSEDDRRHRPRIIVDLANVIAVDAASAEIVARCVADAEATLGSGAVPTIRRASAELNGIYALYQNQLAHGAHDIHLLVTTDTFLARKCAALVETHLRRCGLVVMTYVPDHLTGASTEQFEDGIKTLIYWCAQTLPGYRDQGYTVIFNLVGAFKVLQGYLNTIGMFYADQILYLFESDTAEPVLIPRLPITIDLAAIKPFVVPVALMAEGNAVVPLSALTGLSSVLYDHDGKDAVLSEWGLLIWSQIRTELLSQSLLSFPRLRYEPSFHREFERQNGQERVHLQQKLALVGALLEHSQGDVSILKAHTGLQYDNYTNKRYGGRPIGHFRVAQGLRVSCVTDNGSLALRRYGPEPIVNASP